MDDIYRIREDKVEIEGKEWDDNEVRNLAAKQMVLFGSCRDYWENLLIRGREFFQRYDGSILSDEQIAIYEDVENKIPIQPPIAKSPIRALVGQAMRGLRTGQVTTEGGSLEAPADSAARLEVINAAMKDMETKTDERFRIQDSIHDCFVSCYPNVLYWEKAAPWEHKVVGSTRLKKTHLPWDSCCFGPISFKEVDCSDLWEFFYFDYRAQADLEENFPDMVTQIQDHFENADKEDSRLLTSIENWQGDLSAENRDKLFSLIDQAVGLVKGPTGLVPVVQRLFPVRRQEKVWVNMFDETGDDFELRPPDWEEDRWQQWLKDNPKYDGPYQRTITTLWMTVFTTSGLVLANEKHWFQENGLLPASFWVPCMVNGIPSGPMADMNDEVLANAVGETEYLDDLRKGSGKLLAVPKGAVVNIEELPEEANKSLGIAIIDDGYDAKQIQEFNRQPSEHWKVWAEQRKQAMYENTRINEAMQGQSAPRQSAVAKELEISQAMVTNAIYLENINRCWQNDQNLKLRMIPYAYTSYDVLEIRDEETGQDKTVPVNLEQYDLSGKVENVVNNLTAYKYKWKISAVDDSVTSKENQFREALIFFNTAAGPLLGKDPTGRLFAMTLMAMPNKLMQDMGRKLAQDAQMKEQEQSALQKQETLMKAQSELAKANADWERAKKQGKSLSITGEQLMEYPQLFGMLHQLGIVTQNTPPPGGGTASAQPTAPPAASMPGNAPAAAPTAGMRG